MEYGREYTVGAFQDFPESRPFDEDARRRASMMEYDYIRVIFIPYELALSTFGDLALQLQL